MRTRVLFICTANAARSQIAEALLRSMEGERFDVFSAGMRPADRVHRYTLRVLERAAVSATGHHPKTIDSFRGQAFDFVITLADEAREASEALPFRAAQVIHWSIDDPQAVAATELDFIEALKQIRRRVELFATVTAPRTGNVSWRL
jgi:protein-tyrosine-phosphatase